MTSQGSALTRFRRALDAGDGSGAYAAAAELQVIELADALALTLLLAGDAELYERACVRWVGRLAVEVPGLGLAETMLALSALGAIRSSVAGAHALADLCEAHGQDELVAVVERWLARQGAPDSSASGPAAG